MKVVVNGAEEHVAAGASILAVLELHKLKPESVAVELNRRLVRGAGYGQELKEGDVLEIVTFVGGG